MISILLRMLKREILEFLLALFHHKWSVGNRRRKKIAMRGECDSALWCHSQLIKILTVLCSRILTLKYLSEGEECEVTFWVTCLIKIDMNAVQLYSLHITSVYVLYAGRCAYHYFYYVTDWFFLCAIRRVELRNSTLGINLINICLIKLVE